MTAFQGPVSAMRKSSWGRSEATVKSCAVRRTTLQAIAPFHTLTVELAFLTVVVRSSDR
jgi:hypothetical protein